MKFVSFPSIDNSYMEKTIQYIRMAGYSNGPYYVTEKIHGANFSFWYSKVSKEFKYASREKFTDSTFYRCQKVVDRYKERVISFANSVPGDLVTIYGELFGTGIQKGVSYYDNKDFMAFDVAIDGAPVEFLKFSDRLRDYGIPPVPLIAAGLTLSQALDTPIRWNSLVTEKVFSEGENIAEGVVIAPHIPTYLPSGRRLLLKHKNECFKERAKARRPRKEEPNSLVPVVMEYVNKNRMDSVISKLGIVTLRDFGLVIKKMSNDVLEDMVSDGTLPEDWKSIREFKNAGKTVNQQVAIFLKNNLLRKL